MKSLVNRDQAVPNRRCLAPSPNQNSSPIMSQTARVVTVFGVLRDDVGFGLRHWRRGLALVGYGRHNRAAAERALDLVRQGRLDLARLATHHLPLARYAEGVDLLRRKEAIKVCFLPQEE